MSNPTTTDHGAAGFCTGHGQAADRPTTVAEAVETAARAAFEIKFSGENWLSIPEETRGSWRDALAPILEAVGYADRLAESERLRAVGPIAWTFGQRARADRAEATVARVEAQVRAQVSAEIEAARDVHARAYPTRTERERGVLSALLAAARIARGESS